MGSGVSAPEKTKELALVGMGPGNVSLLRTIVDKGWLGTVFNVTAFDMKDAMHHNLAGPRSLVDETMIDRQFWDYALLAKMVAARSKKGTNVEKVFKFHQARVTSITTDTVTATSVQTGEALTKAFDMCVVGTGSAVPFPGKVTDTAASHSKAHYRRLNALAKAANSIVVVGGGPTGIEVAGEFGYSYGGGKASVGGGKTAGKKITLVHNGAALLSAYDGLKEKVRTRAASKLAGLGVDVLLGQRVDLAALRSGDESKEPAVAGEGDGKEESKGSGGGGDALPDSVITGPVTVATSKGGSIEADLVLVCTGFRVNSAPYAETLAAAVDGRGALKVNLKHEVAGYEGRIWAVGDCCNTPEVKLAYVAAIQGKYIAKALAANAVGKGASVKARKPEGLGMVVTIGPKDGVAQMKGMVMGKKFVPAVKGGDLFVKKMRGDFFGKVQ